MLTGMLPFKTSRSGDESLKQGTTYQGCWGRYGDHYAPFHRVIGSDHITYIVKRSKHRASMALNRKPFTPSRDADRRWPCGARILCAASSASTWPGAVRLSKVPGVRARRLHFRHPTMTGRSRPYSSDGCDTRCFILLWHSRPDRGYSS